MSSTTKFPCHMVLFWEEFQNKGVKCIFVLLLVNVSQSIYFILNWTVYTVYSRDANVVSENTFTDLYWDFCHSYHVTCFWQFYETLKVLYWGQKGQHNIVGSSGIHRMTYVNGDVPSWQTEVNYDSIYPSLHSLDLQNVF